MIYPPAKRPHRCPISVGFSAHYVAFLMHPAHLCMGYPNPLHNPVCLLAYVGVSLRLAGWWGTVSDITNKKLNSPFSPKLFMVLRLDNVEPHPRELLRLNIFPVNQDSRRQSMSRRQNTSCDQCRKGKRACDASAIRRNNRLQEANIPSLLSVDALSCIVEPR